ncbi:MAG: hypothetical protein SCH71_09665 [Desulfobulbaceae bacterium]|nr:hypothetical protein [Desulfobulbaceae bacterium]
MSNESRKAKRYTDFIPVSIHVYQEGSDKSLAGPFSGTIVDVCSSGACLLMSTITLDSFHIYHSTRKNKSAYLQIRIDAHPRLEGTYIDARPVWLNTFLREEFRERMIGVEFLRIEQQHFPDIGALV